VARVAKKAQAGVIELPDADFDDLLPLGAVSDGDGLTAADPPGKLRLVDIEELLQWALARTGRLPWRRDNWRELTLNPYTAQLRRRPPGNWSLAVACAGTSFSLGTGAPAMRIPGSDAELVMLAIAGLGDPVLCEIVRGCARSRIRPDWRPGIVPRRVARMERSRRSHRRVQRLYWVPCSPDEVRAARDAYSRWHAALLRLSRALNGRLSEWQIIGLGAPGEPWSGPGEGER
jgi:hypothetical protein